MVLWSILIYLVIGFEVGAASQNSTTYDHLNRLRSATYGTDLRVHYEYDPVGNIVRREVFRLADAEADGDTDLTDFAVMQRCFGQPALSDSCLPFDLDGSGKVDLDDVRAFVGRMTPPIR